MKAGDLKEILGRLENLKDDSDIDIRFEIEEKISNVSENTYLAKRSSIAIQDAILTLPLLDSGRSELIIFGEKK